jgi:carboxypeptidase C (cathepsin A)
VWVILMLDKMWQEQRLMSASHCVSRIRVLCWLVLCLFFILPTKAQYPPPVSQDNITTVRSAVDGNVTVTWKTPSVGTCTTVFSTQKQYSGYVTLPPNITGQNYDINTFFWFFEARQVPESAPLTVFINGGPGSSSLIGLFQEVGPCQVVEIAKGKLGTIAREWGWDRSSNIIFIDQPVQVGFSYDILTNASLNLIDELLSYPASQIPNTQPSYTFLNGTFASGNSNNSASTSEVAAQAIWHFLQAFLGVFPQYNPAVSSDGVIVSGTTGINLFTESYGGKYGPAIGALFGRQNALRQTDAAMMNSTLEITLATLGIMNGWIDLVSAFRGAV